MLSDDEVKYNRLNYNMGIVTYEIQRAVDVIIYNIVQLIVLGDKMKW
jgi:hypothetical protein